MDFTEKEKTVLAGFAHGTLGGPKDNCGCRKDYLDALEAVKAKGWLHKVWVLSPEGQKAADEAERV